MQTGTYLTGHGAWKYLSNVKDLWWVSLSPPSPVREFAMMQGIKQTILDGLNNTCGKKSKTFTQKMLKVLGKDWFPIRVRCTTQRTRHFRGPAYRTWRHLEAQSASTKYPRLSQNYSKCKCTLFIQPFTTIHFGVPKCFTADERWEKCKRPVLEPVFVCHFWATLETEWRGRRKTCRIFWI